MQIEGAMMMRAGFAMSSLFFLIPALHAQASSSALPRVEEARLLEYWKLGRPEGKPPALYPKSAVAAGASGCVAVAFRIDENGVPAQARVLRSYISKKEGDAIRAEFEQRVLENVPHWRYVPVTSAPQAVDTYVTVTAVAALGLQSKKLRDDVAAHCRVDDFLAEPAAPAANAE
jgi:TonB family protein